MSKICSKCLQNKDESEFSKRSGSIDGLQYRCKLCVAANSAKHYVENKTSIIEKSVRRRNGVRDRVNRYKSNVGCLLCPEDNYCCLDFHHPFEDKERGVAEMVSVGNGWDTILTEIEKCVVLCSNCHRKIHSGMIELL
jgi:hypothetical protein